MDVYEVRRLLERIRQRQMLYRLAFAERRATRTVLFQQALAFEEWLGQLIEEYTPGSETSPLTVNPSQQR